MRRRSVLSLVLVAALAGVVVLLALDPLQLRVPHWVAWHTGSYTTDLAAGGDAEIVTLADRSVIVRSYDGTTLYQTPSEWQVSDARTCDVTGDGTSELLMLVWRRGNYGSSRPFWETGRDLRMTEHLYVFGMRDGVLVPVWMGHELGRSVTEVRTIDEGTVTLVERDGGTTAWTWDGFGFVAA